MAEPERRVRNGKVRWYARYHDPDGRRRCKVFDRRVDAQRYLTQVESSKLTGDYIDPARAKLTVGVWADKWLEGQGHLKPSARARYEGIVVKYVKPRWGQVPLNKVSHADVAAWLSGLSHLSASSVRHVHRTLSLIMDLAVRDGRLSKNPAAGVKLPRLPKDTKRFLTHDEVWAVANASAQYPTPEAGQQYRALILVLAFCGLRWGEVAGLKVGRLDLLKRRITVAETLIDVGGHLVWDTPKSHAARDVHLPPFITDELVGHVAGKGPEDLVFTSSKGRPLSNRNFRRYTFNPAIQACGLQGLTPHELRHTAASLAVSAGANVKAVQRMLGHASAAMTLDVYAGLFNDDLEAVAQRLHQWYQNGTEPADAEVVDLAKHRSTR